MRRTRRKRVDKDKKDRLYTIFAFFIVAPIISIVLGFALVQYVILPRLDAEQKAINPIEEKIGEEEKSETKLNIDADISDTEDKSEPEPIEEKNDASNNEEENVKETTFFGVQLGNFSSITNAQVLAKELKENNIDGYIVSDGNFYRVFAGEFNVKEEAYNYLENIREIYEDAFVNLVSSNEEIIRPD